MPLVSVIIPCRPGEPFVQEAIDSVYRQDLPSLEIIEVVDGDSHLGQGPAAARNAGIQYSRGKYIAFLDADDLFLPAKLRRQVAYFEQNRQLGLVTCHYYRVGPAGSIITRHRSLRTWPNRRAQVESLLKGAFLPTSTVMVRRECFDEVGLFDERYRVAEDHEMWLRLATHFGFGVLPETMAGIRMHHGSYTQGISRDTISTVVESIRRRYDSALAP